MMTVLLNTNHCSAPGSGAWSLRGVTWHTHPVYAQTIDA